MRPATGKFIYEFSMSVVPVVENTCLDIQRERERDRVSVSGVNAAWSNGYTWSRGKFWPKQKKKTNYLVGGRRTGVTIARMHMCHSNNPCNFGQCTRF